MQILGALLNRRFHPAYWLTSILFLLSVPIQATTIVMPTDEQLIAKAEVIVRASVLSSEVVEEGSAIYTDSVVGVESILKGSPGLWDPLESTCRHASLSIL